MRLGVRTGLLGRSRGHRLGDYKGGLSAKTVAVASKTTRGHTSELRAKLASLFSQSLSRFESQTQASEDRKSIPQARASRNKKLSGGAVLAVGLSVGTLPSQEYAL